MDKTVARSIWFESLSGGVGRSVLAINLAFELAALGHRVCLLELDHRLPSIHEYFGLPQKQASVVAGMRLLRQERLDEGKLAELCIRLVARGAALDYLSGFGLPINNIDFGILERFVELVHEKYDFVVVDSAAWVPKVGSAGAAAEMRSMALRKATKRLLVVPADQVGLARLADYAADLEVAGIGQLDILLNRAVVSNTGRLVASRTIPQLQKAIRDVSALPLTDVVLEDRAFDEAASRGLPLRQIGQKSKALAVIADLAVRFAGSL